MSLASSPAQLNEQEIQFKKRARRRLVGAIALVLLMVAVLPMILDDRQDKTPPQDIAISIPSQDEDGFTSKIVPPPAEDAAGNADSNAAMDEMETPPETKPAAEKSPQADKEQASAIADMGAAGGASQPIVNPATAVPSSKPPAQPANPAKPGNIYSKPAPASAIAAKPAAAALKPAETAKAQALPVTPGQVSVQIGVFSDVANIKQMQQKLSGMGLKSYTEKIHISTGEKIRLRVGPFASRPEAEAALTKIKSAGLSGILVSNIE